MFHWIDEVIDLVEEAAAVLVALWGLARGEGPIEF